MKRIVSSTFLLAVLVQACSFPSILGDEKQNAEASPDATRSGQILLKVDITGGFAGVQQNLLVDQAGNAQFTDSFHNGETFTIQLTESETGELKNLMSDNNFFQLNDSYVDTGVADAFLYSIFYREGERSKTVQTDVIAAPENLARIVQGILEIISQISGNGLQIELRLNKTQIKPGEKVESTLLVTNVTDSPITLTFNSGQIFDFLVAKVPPPGSLAPEILIWNWAHDKAFTLQIWTLVLQPGQTESYLVNWDGTDNNGNPVEDTFVMRATLLSIPGGSPEEKSIVVEN